MQVRKNLLIKLVALLETLNIHVFLVAHTKKLADETVIPDASHILGVATLEI